MGALGLSNPQPGNVMPAGQASSVSTTADISTENPSQAQPGNNFFSTSNVSKEDQDELVAIISEYRNSWAQDRLERIRQWMENLFYWRGIQIIRWDTATNCWYDALAWARTQNQDTGEDTDLERWINPLTLMFCNVFTATMSREAPATVVKPQNADPNLKDSVTAKAAVDAIRIIEKQNELRKMVRDMFEILFLFGSYFRYTRPVIDGEMFGYDEAMVFEDMDIQSGPHYSCPNCGTETPATDQNGMECPACGAFMGQESYFAAGEGNRTSLRSAGTNKIPRAGVKQSIHTPLEIDVDPKAKGKDPLKQTAILAKDTEIDFGEACQMFPAMREFLEPGAEISTTANASMEKLSRLDAVSALGGMTADNSLMNPTYSEVWMRPMSYFKRKNWAFADRMKKQFPEGLKISMVGEFVVDIRPAVLEKEWSHCALYTNQGVYCNALANTAVSFNARFNRTMWILDDWASRAATGLNVVDAGRLDTEKFSGKPIPAGTLTPIPMRINGEPRPMAESFMHFDLPINPALWNYPMMLMTFCELIIGIPRQIAGQGTQEDVETLGGQQLQLARAATTLKPYWENVKDEHAEASQNAFECLQSLMKAGAVRNLIEVIESKGGAFENKEIGWDKLQGNVEFSIDEDQDLPVDPSELRESIKLMFESLANQNPAAVAWFDVPENQELAQGCLVPDSVIPDEAQRLKTEADIQMILDQGAQVAMNPDGSVGAESPAHPDEFENFPIARQVLQRFLLKNFQLRVEKPDRWILLNQYWQELKDLDTKVAADQSNRQMQVNAAGAPPKPQPDPNTVAAVRELQKLAVQMTDRLAQLSMVDPLITKQTITGQKDSAKAVVDSALDASKAMMGEQ